MAFKQGNNKVVSANGLCIPDIRVSSSTPKKKRGEGHDNVSRMVNDNGQDVIYYPQNLDIRHYRNGDPLITGSWDTFASSTEGAFLITGDGPGGTGGGIYKHQHINQEIYGLHYNFWAVMDLRGIAPMGWHIDCSDMLRSPNAEVGFRKSPLTAYSFMDPSQKGWANIDETTLRNEATTHMLAAGSMEAFTGSPDDKIRETAFIWSGRYPNAQPAAIEGGIYTFNYDDSVVEHNLYNPSTGASLRPRKDPPAVDIDGNRYETITVQGRFGAGNKVINQCWTIENHRGIRFNDGTDIMIAAHQDHTDLWLNDGNHTVRRPMATYCTTKALCISEDPASNLYSDFDYRQSINDYGLLYNGWAVNPAYNGGKTLAPTAADPGWRMPTKDDYTLLKEYVDDTYTLNHIPTASPTFAQTLVMKDKVHRTLAESDLGWTDVDGISEAPIMTTGHADNWGVGDLGFCATMSGGRTWDTGAHFSDGFHVWMADSSSDELWAGRVTNHDGTDFPIDPFEVAAGNGMQSGFSIRFVYDLPYGEGVYL